MPGKLPAGDVARVRVSAPDRAARIRDYLSETGDPDHLFCGPLEAQARFSPHASPLQALAERRMADL